MGTQEPEAVEIWQGLSDSPARTQEVGRRIGMHLEAGDVVALVGELGSGKTQLVRGLAQGLGVDEKAVASPTFVMVHEYPPKAEGRGLRLVHVDAYRVRAVRELESLGWSESPGEMWPGAVVVIEWAERLQGQLPGNRLEVVLEHAGENQRRIRVLARGEWIGRAERLRAELEKWGGKSRPCPICKKPVREDDPFFPFCSKPCKLVDLGRWLSGHYVISRPLEQRDLEEGVD